MVGFMPKCAKELAYLDVRNVPCHFKKPDFKIVKGKRVYEKTIPVHLQAVSNICNQLLRFGTSIGANNAEATNAISKTDYRSKSFIALKEARESLYWIALLYRNGYIDEKQYK